MRFEGGYAGNDFSVLDVYLNEKTQAVKIHLLNIFKDHHIVAELDPTAIDYDGWSLWMEGLWRKFYSDYGKYNPELSEYFQMYRQLNISIFCATSAVSISWQHLNYLNLTMCSVY